MGRMACLYPQLKNLFLDSRMHKKAIDRLQRLAYYKNCFKTWASAYVLKEMHKRSIGDELPIPASESRKSVRQYCLAYIKYIKERIHALWGLQSL